MLVSSAKLLSQPRALQVVVGGITLQGTGFMVSIMIYSAFIYRLMTQKLPKEPLRPGMFVSVGPAAFTITGLINMGENLSRSFPPDFMGNGPMAGFYFENRSKLVGGMVVGIGVLVFPGICWSSCQYCQTWQNDIRNGLVFLHLPADCLGNGYPCRRKGVWQPCDSSRRYSHGRCIWLAFGSLSLA